MMDVPEPPLSDHDFFLLLERCCDGQLTEAADIDRFRRELQGSYERRRQFYDYFDLHAELHWLESSFKQTVELETPRTWTAAAWQWLSHPTALSLLVSGLFLTVLMLSLALWTMPVWREQLAAPQWDRRQIVAEVIASQNAQWAPASLTSEGPPVDLFIGQTVELLQGSATIRFDGGAMVLLEGPALFSPQGGHRLQLSGGKLAARVPPRAVGFLVGTPTVDVIDLGTEFGVRVTQAETEVQVLTGSVEVQRTSHSGTRFANYVLQAGEAALFGRSSTSGFYVQETEMNRSALLGMMALLGGAALEGTPVSAAQLVLYFNGVDQNFNPQNDVSGIDAGQAYGVYTNGNFTTTFANNQSQGSAPTEPTPAGPTANTNSGSRWLQFAAGGGPTANKVTNENPITPSSSHVGFTVGNSHDDSFLRLNSLVFDFAIASVDSQVAGSGGFVGRYQAFYSLDGGENFLSIGEGGSVLNTNANANDEFSRWGTGAHTQTVDLTALPLLEIGQEIEFRIALADNRDNGHHMLFIQGVQLNGEFEPAQLVPEPSAWLLSGAGLIGVGLLLYRRKRTL